MAVRDVKNYYYSLLMQSAEMKADLEDFEKALKAGYITEDKLAEVKEQVKVIEANFERVGYIMYLLEIPNRGKKAAKWKAQKSNQEIAEYFASKGADEKAVYDESKSALDHLREEIKKLEKEIKEEK